MTSFQPPERISLAAGEEAVLIGTGLIAVALADGALESAAMMLAPGITYRFNLRPLRRISIYSLEGGTFITAVAVGATCSISKGSTNVAELHEAAAVVMSRAPTYRVVVLARRPLLGKSTVARSLCNLLLRRAIGDTETRIVYVDGDPTATDSDRMVSPGVVSCAEVFPPGIPPDASFIESQPISFFAGISSAADPNDAALSLHCFGQCIASADWILRRDDRRSRGLFIDAPLPPLDSVSSSVQDTSVSDSYLRQIVEIAAPNVIVCVSDTPTEFSALRSTLARSHPGAAFVVVPQPELRVKLPVVVLPPSASSKGSSSSEALLLNPPSRPTDTEQHQQLLWAHAQQQLLQATSAGIAEYFVGVPALPMACAHCVVAFKDITFVTVAVNQGVVVAEVFPPPYQALSGRICAVSHAVQLEEVGFANIAGLVRITLVDKEHGEIEMTVPSGEGFIPGPFLIVGHPGLSCDEELIARSRI